MKLLDKLPRTNQKTVWEYNGGLYSEKCESVWTSCDLFIKIELFRLYEGPVNIRLYLIDSNNYNQYQIYLKRGRTGEDLEVLEDFVLQKCEQFRNFYRDE